MREEVLNIKHHMYVEDKKNLVELRNKVIVNIDNNQEKFINSLILTTSNFIGATASFTGLLIIGNNILSGINNVSYSNPTAICTFTGINIVLFPLFLNEYKKNAKETIDKKTNRDLQVKKYNTVDQKIFLKNLDIRNILLEKDEYSVNMRKN